MLWSSEWPPRGLCRLHGRSTGDAQVLPREEGKPQTPRDTSIHQAKL